MFLQPHTSNLKPNSGFTFIELILVFATLAIVAAITFPVTEKALSRNNLDVMSHTIEEIFLTARTFAISGTNNSDWGVHIDTDLNTVTLFSGSSYLTHEPDFDEVTTIPSTLVLSSPSDFVFTRGTGIPDTTGTVSISLGSTQKDISINEQGKVTLALHVADGGGGGSVGALSFDGSSGYVDIGNPSTVYTPSEITIAVWVNMQGGDFTYRPAVVTHKDAGNNDSPMEIYIGDSLANEIKMQIYAGGSYAGTTRGVSGIPSNSWHFLTGTYNGSAFRTYVDGSLVDAQSDSGALLTNPDDMWLGAGFWDGSGYPFFNGYMDELAIWNRALSDGEISDLYNGGVGVAGDVSMPPFNDGLVAGYHFNESDGTTLSDYSGNGHNGVLHDGVSWIEGLLQ